MCVCVCVCVCAYVCVCVCVYNRAVFTLTQLAKGVQKQLTGESHPYYYYYCMITLQQDIAKEENQTATSCH